MCQLPKMLTHNDRNNPEQTLFILLFYMGFYFLVERAYFSKRNFTLCLTIKWELAAIRQQFRAGLMHGFGPALRLNINPFMT